MTTTEAATTATETAEQKKARFKFDPDAIKLEDAEIVSESELESAFQTTLPEDHPLYQVYTQAREKGVPVRIKFGDTPFEQVQAFLRKAAQKTGNGLRIKQTAKGEAVIKVGEKRKHERKATAKSPAAPAADKPAAGANRNKRPAAPTK